jgi:hypothetical protein
VNDTIQSIAASTGFTPIQTIAYSHQENVIVKRVNKELIRHLRAILLEYSLYNDWSLAIPFVQRIINTNKHSSLGVSPSQILFSNNLDLERGLLVPFEEAQANLPPERTVSEYMRTLIEQQAIIIQIAQRHLKETETNAAQRRKRKHDSNNLEEKEGQTLTQSLPEYQVNDFVLLAWPSSGHHQGPPDKRKPILRGPFQVIEIKDNHLKVQNLATNHVYTIKDTEQFIKFIKDNYNTRQPE